MPQMKFNSFKELQDFVINALQRDLKTHKTKEGLLMLLGKVVLVESFYANGKLPYPLIELRLNLEDSLNLLG